MEAMTTCEPCTLRAAGDTARAEAIESIRSQRLVLAVLNGASDAFREIHAELGGCQDCTGRLAAQYLTMTAQALVKVIGSVEAAIYGLERGLLQDLDDQNSAEG